MITNKKEHNIFRAFLHFVVVLLVVLFDRATKMLAVKHLMPISTYPLIQDVLHLTYVENTGAAFGMLKDHRWVFMVFSILMLVVLAVVVYKYKSDIHTLMMTGISFVIGGGIGNMIDRTVFGYVVDFIDFRIINFAVFNVADTFICIGVGLIILDVVLKKSKISFLYDTKANEDVKE